MSCKTTANQDCRKESLLTKLSPKRFSENRQKGVAVNEIVPQEVLREMLCFKRQQENTRKERSQSIVQSTRHALFLCTRTCENRKRSNDIQTIRRHRHKARILCEMIQTPHNTHIYAQARSAHPRWDCMISIKVSTSACKLKSEDSPPTFTTADFPDNTCKRMRTSMQHKAQA